MIMKDDCLPKVKIFYSELGVFDLYLTVNSWNAIYSVLKDWRVKILLAKNFIR
jgi:hypothetical protein